MFTEFFIFLYTYLKWRISERSTFIQRRYIKSKIYLWIYQKNV